MNTVFLWRFSALRCDMRAICWTRSSAVTCLPSFQLKKQRHEQHWTKNSPKTATNCAQITHKTQRQPPVKVSEVYFHTHNFILAFWKPKWISHTNSYSEGHITRSYSYFELGPPVISQAGSGQGDCSAWYSMYICKSPWPSKHSLHGNLSAWLAGILASHCWDPGKLGWDFPI